MKFKRYEGTLNTRNPDMCPLAKRAFSIFLGQCRRCNWKDDVAYSRYGARGIRVEYDSRDFVGWWLAAYAMRKKWSRPSVGRIDHDKNYSFDNIEMVEHKENAREMYGRTGGNRTVAKVPVVLVGEDVTHAFSDVASAAKFAGVTASYICLRKRVKADPKKKTKFPYAVYDLDDFLKGNDWPPLPSSSLDTPASASA